MLVSAKFRVTIEGTHGVVIPNKIAQPFKDAGHSRVALKAIFKD